MYHHHPEHRESESQSSEAEPRHSDVEAPTPRAARAAGKKHRKKYPGDRILKILAGLLTVSAIAGVVAVATPREAPEEPDSDSSSEPGMPRHPAPVRDASTTRELPDEETPLDSLSPESRRLKEDPSPFAEARHEQDKRAATVDGRRATFHDGWTTVVLRRPHRATTQGVTATFKFTGGTGFEAVIVGLFSKRDYRNANAPLHWFIGRPQSKDGAVAYHHNNYKLYSKRNSGRVLGKLKTRAPHFNVMTVEMIEQGGVRWLRYYEGHDTNEASLLEEINLDEHGRTGDIEYHFAVSLCGRKNRTEVLELL